MELLPLNFSPPPPPVMTSLKLAAFFGLTSRWPGLRQRRPSSSYVSRRYCVMYPVAAVTPWCWCPCSGEFFNTLFIPWHTLGSEPHADFRGVKGCGRRCHLVVQRVCYSQPVPGRHFSHIHVDLVGPVQVSLGSHSHMMTIIQTSTREVDVVPLSSTTVLQ